MDVFIPLLGRRLNASYFYIKVSAADIQELLNQADRLFDFVDSRKMLDTLEQGNHLIQDPFVLLIDSMSKELEPVIWAEYVNYHVRLVWEALYTSRGIVPEGDPAPPLGDVKVRSQHIIWNEYDMVLVVDILPLQEDGVRAQGRYRHV